MFRPTTKLTIHNRQEGLIDMSIEMKRITRMATVAALVFGCAALLQPAYAICGSFIGFTFDSQNGYIFTPGCEASDCGTIGTSMTDNARGTFWAINEGSPALMAGIDNGSFPLLPDDQKGWGYPYPGYPMRVNSGWGDDPRIDNCIETAADPNKCMVVLFMDTSPINNAGAFALATDAADSGSGEYDFLYSEVTLTTLPKMQITNTVRNNGGESVSVTVDGVSLADLQSGFYLDPACPTPAAKGFPQLIQGYQVYARELPRDAPMPTDSNVAAWNPVGPLTPLGDPSTVTLPCSGDTDRYVSAGVVFNSNFSNVWLAENATKVQCGANLADPIVTPERKVPGNRERPDSRSRGR